MWGCKDSKTEIGDGVLPMFSIVKLQFGGWEFSIFRGCHTRFCGVEEFISNDVRKRVKGGKSLQA